MIDARTQCKALKMRWIKAIKYQHSASSQDFWYAWLKTKLPDVDILFFLRCNLNKTDLKKVCTLVNSPFWLEVLELWCEYNFANYTMNKQEILHQPIWFNSLLKIGKKLVFNKKWYDKNIKLMSDLIVNNRWITSEELSIKYNTNINFLELRSIISCIPSHWKYIIFEYDENEFAGYKIDMY